MKKYLFFFTVLSSFGLQTFSATRTTIASGNFSDPNIWDCTCVPTSSDAIILSDDDSLFIDVNATVIEVRYEYSDQASAFIVNSGVTFNTSDDFIIDLPNTSDATANIIILGTMNVGSAAGDDFRIFLENNEDNLTYNIDVQGSLNIAGVWQHSSGLNSTGNIINLTVSGSMDVNNMISTFQAANSEFNLTVSGNFDANNISFTFNGNNSIYRAVFENGADADAISPTMTMNGTNSLIRVEVLQGGDYRASSGLTYNLSNTSGGSKIEIIVAGIYRAANYTFNTQAVNDSLALHITSTGEMRSGTQIRGNASGSGNHQDIVVDAGGSLITTTNLRFDLAIDGTFNLVNNGSIFTIIPNTYDFMFFAGNTVTGTFDNSGSMNFRDFRFTFGVENVFTLDQNGILNANRNFDLSAKDDNLISVNLNETLTTTGRYYSSTNGDNSAITTNVFDSLICGQLRMDVLTTAATADNVINLDNANAVLSCTSINMDIGNDATIISGNSNNSSITFTGATTTDLPVRASVEYDNIIVSNTSGTGLTLNEGDLDNSNFNGDLTITAGARFNVDAAINVDVQGNMTNAGTYDNGNGLSVTGNLSTSFLFTNHGSDISVGGDFTNSGTFDNQTSKPALLETTGNFLNTGTFAGAFDNTDVAGNFTNSGLYSSQGNNINVAGDFSSTGTYTWKSGDVVTFNGSAAQSISGTQSIYDMVVNNSSTGVSITGGTTSVQRFLTIQDGQLSTGGNLVFLSNDSLTAALTDMSAGTGSITGNVTVQRFLDEGNGWYMIGSPVTGATLADWNTELPMSGFTGSDEPTHPFISVYNYTESARSGAGFLKATGYTPATNITNSLVPGRGWFVYFQSVKPAATAKTYDVTGPLQTGPVSTGTLSYTNSGGGSERGWHLLANPFASPVQWNLLTLTQITGGTGYVMRTDGSYGDIVNAGIGYLYSGEAFWIQGLSATASIVFNENDKVTEIDDYNFRMQNKPEYKFPLNLELTYSGNSTYKDYSVLRFGGDSNSVYFDKVVGESYKIVNATGTLPSIGTYSFRDSTEIFYNTLNPEDSAVEIPIKIWEQYPSNTLENYTVTFNGIETWVKNNKCLILEDRMNNVTQKLDENNTDYSFAARDTINTPFIYLNYSVPLTVEQNNATCFGYNDGFASVLGLGSGSHNYLWVDHMNNIVKNEKDKTGASTVNNLAPGEYVVYVSDNGACGNIAATITITEPDAIVADFDSDVDSVWMNANSTIYFSNASINADEYHWEFGDGNTSDLESPAHTYTAGGTYTVKLVGITGPCSDTLTKTVVVFDNVGIDDQLSRFKDPINIYQYNDETYVDLNFSEPTDVIISMFDVLGRNIIEPMNLMNVKERKELLNVPGNLMGVYTISVIAGDEKESKKIYYTRK